MNSLRHPFAYFSLVLFALPFCTFGDAPAQSQDDSAGACAVTASAVVTTAEQRKAATGLVQPPHIVGPTGFDWPDTELGAVRVRHGNDLLFFGSDGSCHANCGKQNERDGSITRTAGTFSDPLGKDLPSRDRPVVETILPQTQAFKDRAVIYVGGGPTYRVPPGHPGAGDLLLVYQAARNTDLVAQTGQYGYLGIALSGDDGVTWKDLGLFIQANQPYDPKATSDYNLYDIGNGSLVADPTETYLYIYFPDKLSSLSPGSAGINTFFSVARVNLDELLSPSMRERAGDRFEATDSEEGRYRQPPHFWKFYEGRWNQPGIGGLSTPLLGLNPPYAGDSFVSYSEYLHRYVVILDDTQEISYATSKDGVHWDAPLLLKSYATEPASILYGTAYSADREPGHLGKQFHVYFTYYPTDGTGWDAATLRRLTVDCIEPRKLLKDEGR